MTDLDPLRDTLASAPATVVGRFNSASNATLLVGLHDAAGEPPPMPESGSLDDLDPLRFAVYKPQLGEAPLWDFDNGTLWRREIAAWVVDRALGLGMVPTTVRRDDLEHGVGSLQQLVPHDPDEHYFELREDPALHARLRQMVVLDVLMDNADRKGGHVLLDRSGAEPRIRLIDHGVCFHAEPHLRTVAWDFAGEPASDDERSLGERLGALLDDADDSVAALHDLLSVVEVERLRARAVRVARMRELPVPEHDRQYPWPLL